MGSAAHRASGVAFVIRGGPSEKVVPWVFAAILCTAAKAVAREAAPAGPATDFGPVAAQYVEGFIQRLRAEVRAEGLSRGAGSSPSSEQKTGRGESLPGRLASASPEVQQAAFAILAAQAEPLEHDLRKAAADLEQKLGEMAAAWTPVRAALYERGALLGRLRRDQAGGLVVAWSLDDHWFWASLLLAWAALGACAIHASRHALRRRWGGRLSRAARRALAVGGFVLAACLAAGLGFLDRWAGSQSHWEPPPDSLPLPANDSAKRIDLDLPGAAAADASVELSQATAANRSARVVADAKRLLPANATQLRGRALEVAERLETLDRLSRAIQADLDRLNQLQGELREASAAVVRLESRRKAIRGLLGAVSLVGVGAGAWFLRREARRSRDRLGTTCPLCLGPIQPGTASRNGRADGAARMIRCDNLLDPGKGIRCNFAIREAYRTMPRLCFPTLGVPRAGKTHWLAMTYWQLNRGGYPRWIRMERVRPAQIAGGEDFDRVVQQILISRLGTSATQGARIPHPLVFQFADCDPWGRSSLLVNIFDYSGELTGTVSVDDYRRRRAMEADGYLFFLDPTLPAEPQAKALADFREDLRLMKALSGCRPFWLPLALCVSKIDLLAGQSYAMPGGGDAVARFYEELARIDPTGESMTLDVLRARSRLTAELSATIWPGWQIEPMLEDAFRGRWMFFPLTPVGLDGRGETDLSLRTIAPFGLVEPLAWLLHMNGYSVFP